MIIKIKMIGSEVENISPFDVAFGVERLQRLLMKNFPRLQPVASCKGEEASEKKLDTPEELGVGERDCCYDSW